MLFGCVIFFGRGRRGGEEEGVGLFFWERGVFFCFLMNFMPCFNILERSFETKAHSEESTNVSDMKVADEDDFLSKIMMIKAKNIIMKRVLIAVREEPNLNTVFYQRDHVWNTLRSHWAFSSRPSAQKCRRLPRAQM